MNGCFPWLEGEEEGSQSEPMWECGLGVPKIKKHPMSNFRQDDDDRKDEELTEAQVTQVTTLRRTVWNGRKEIFSLTPQVHRTNILHDDT